MLPHRLGGYVSATVQLVVAGEVLCGGFYGGESEARSLLQEEKEKAKKYRRLTKRGKSDHGKRKEQERQKTIPWST